MSDERGGKYYREARFFLGGDKVAAQGHIGEARQVLGYLRDMQSLGGPAIQVQYATLQDGSTIKAVLVNGQYQAEIISPIRAPRGKKRRIVRYAQVCAQVDPDTNVQQRIGMPFNTSGPMFGDVPGTRPQILYGTDLGGYKTYPEYVGEYALAGADNRDPTGDDDFSCGIGRKNWWTAPGEPVFTCGRAMGDDPSVLLFDLREHVFRDGKTIATPGTGIYHAVLGAAVYTLGDGTQKLVVPMVTTGKQDDISAITVSVKVAAYDAEDDNYFADDTMFTTIGTYTFPSIGTWENKIPYYSFAVDGSKAVGVFGTRAITAFSIDPTCSAATFTYDDSHWISTDSTGLSVRRGLLDAVYSKTGGFKLLRFTHQDVTVTSSSGGDTGGACVGIPNGTDVSVAPLVVHTTVTKTGIYEVIDDAVTTQIGEGTITSVYDQLAGVVVQCVGGNILTTSHETYTMAGTYNNIPRAWDLRYDAVLVHSTEYTSSGARDYYTDSYHPENNTDTSTETYHVVTHAHMLNATPGPVNLDFDEDVTVTDDGFTTAIPTFFTSQYYEHTFGPDKAQYPFQATSGAFADAEHFSVITSLPSGTLLAVLRDGGGFGTVPIVGGFERLYAGDSSGASNRNGAAIGLVSVRDEQDEV